MRIIAGTAKGRTIAGPRGSGTRPMTDRAREALFSSLGTKVHDARVLDLYAGSGSLGLESLSRGAASVVFVERGKEAIGTLQRNIARVGLGGEVRKEDVHRYLDRCRSNYDLVFVDPPYALSLASVEEVLRKLVPRLTEGATIVVHRRADERAPEVSNVLHRVAERTYGDSRLWTYEKEDP
jgi:16S rRNA (guanine966-N2)-methyltransferase